MPQTGSDCRWGVDGYDLLESILAAIRLAPLGIPAVLTTGPVMATARIAALREQAQRLDARVEVLRPDMDAVLAGARAVVAMAGYNTVAEVIGSGARRRPRAGQARAGGAQAGDRPAARPRAGTGPGDDRWSRGREHSHGAELATVAGESPSSA
jgi:hypothetical protein